LLREDFAIEDRRPALRSAGRGRAAFIASSKAIGSVNRMDVTPLATRGERLSLASVEMAGVQDGGVFEVPFLVVFEIDEAGLGIGLIAFDPADIDAAFEELDHRFAAGEGAGVPAN
jgi:hypothetical protein